MIDVIYFEVNNWFAGRDYPDSEPFLSWMYEDCDIPFSSDDWAKENKLCIVVSIIDMSQNFCVTATKEWVEKNCPELLTKYQRFLRQPDEDGDVYGRFETKFLEYAEENIGVEWREDEY